MIDKCPLCGGTFAGNICEFCGYALPREEELAAVYNLDPADYPQENPVREIIPEHISEEIYPNREKIAVKEVRNASQSLSEFLCDGAEIFKETAVPQKPIVVKVRKRNMQLTAGYAPNTRLKVKRVEKKPPPASEQNVTFKKSMSELGWLFVLGIIFPTASIVALIAVIKKDGKINGKFTAALLAVLIIRSIIMFAITPHFPVFE